MVRWSAMGSDHWMSPMMSGVAPTPRNCTGDHVMQSVTGDGAIAAMEPVVYRFAGNPFSDGECSQSQMTVV